METSNIVPRGGAPSHGKTTPRLRYAAACRHTVRLDSRPCKAGCSDAVTWATLALADLETAYRIRRLWGVPVALPECSKEIP